MGAPFAELGPLGLLLVLLIAIRGTEKVRGVLWREEIREREREGGRNRSEGLDGRLKCGHGCHQGQGVG